MLLKVFKCGQAETEALGNDEADTHVQLLFGSYASFFDLARSYYKTNYKTLLQIKEALITIGECSMDKALKALLTLLSLLATIVEINSAFHNATSIYMRILFEQTNVSLFYFFAEQEHKTFTGLFRLYAYINLFLS